MRLTEAEYDALMAKRKQEPKPEKVEAPVIAVQRSTDRLNKTEEAYAQYLELLKRAGKIRDYKPQAIKLYLADSCWYVTDFLVINNQGQIEIHETKGFMRDDALVKFKVATATYPFFRFKMVRKVKERDGGGWDIKDGNFGIIK